MNCSNTFSQYVDFLKNLIIYDSKFLNYDEVAKFILNVEDLATENKIASLYNIARFFTDNKESNLETGIADNVIKLSALVEDDKIDEFFVELNNQLGLSTTVEKTTIDLFNDILTKPSILRKDVEAIIQSILKEGKENNKEVIDKLQIMLTKKPLLLHLFNSSLNETQNATSSYIPLNEVEGLNNVWILLKDFTQIYGNYDVNTETFTDNKGEVIDNSIILASKNSRKQNEKFSLHDNKSNIWSNDVLTNNLTIVPLNDNYTIEDINAANKHLMGGGNFKIQMVEVSDEAQERVNQIQAHNKSLQKRTLETFETEGQKKSLINGEAQTVLTVSRPLPSEQKVMFIVELEVNGNPLFFSLYGLNTFTFVNADNSTSLVNFNNQGDLTKIKQLTLKQTLQGYQQLNNNDLQHLKHSNNVYNSFREEAMRTQITTNKADVTDIFNKYYSVSKGKIQTLQNLVDKIESKKPYKSGHVISIPVVKMIKGQPEKDSNGRIIYTMKEVPVILNRIGNGIYDIVNTLEENETVYSAGQAVSLSVYLRQRTDSTGNNWIQYFSDKLYQNDIRTNAITHYAVMLFDFDKDGNAYPRGTNNPYNVIEVPSASRTPQNTIFTLTRLNDVLTSPNKANEILTKLRSDFFFNPATSIKNKQPLFSISWSKGLQGELQLRFTAFSSEQARSQKYASLFNKANETPNLKNTFNFNIDEQTLLKLYDRVKNSKLIAKLQADNPNLPQQLETANEWKAFAKGVSKMNSKEAKEFETLFTNKLQNELVNVFLKSVINKIENKSVPEHQKELFDEFVEMLTEDFTGKDGKVHLDYILMHELPFSRQQSLNINYPGQLPTGFSQYNTVEKQQDILSIKTKKQEEDVVNGEDISNSTEIVEQITPVTEPEQQHIEQSQEERNDDDIIEFNDDDIPISFKLTSVVTDTVSEEVFQQEAEFVKDMLGDIETIFEDLGSLNGNIIAGQLKDDVIYLNNTVRKGGVAFHEAFHRVFQRSLNEETQQRLIREVKSNPTYAKYFTQEALEKFRKERNYSENANLSDLQAEEILADGFADYTKNKTNKVIKNKFIARLFSWLKELIKRVLGKQNEIESIYDRALMGYYRNTVINNTQRSEIRYELIPGLRTLFISDEGSLQQRQSYLPSDYYQSQLINFVTAKIASNNEDISFDKKFEQAVKDLLENEFNLNKILASETNLALLNKNPQLKEKAFKKLGAIYANYRFMLGARELGESIYDFNITEDPKYNQVKIKQVIKDAKGETYDNNNGQYSKELLKEAVKKAYDQIGSISDLINIDEIENAVETDNQEDSDDGIKSGTDSFESDLLSFNVVKQNVGLVRKFLSNIRRDYVDDELDGIVIPRMISAEDIFPVMAKISSNTPYSLTIENLKIYSDIIREDGNVNYANDLEAIYKALVNKDGSPKDKQFYQLMTNVLFGVELDYMFFKPTVLKNEKDKSLSIRYKIEDKLLSSDMSKKRERIYQTFIETWGNNLNSNSFKQSITALKERIDLMNKLSTTTVLTDINISNNDLKLKNQVDFFYTHFKNIGLNIPKSTLRLSFIAIEKEINSNAIFSDKNENFYNSFLTYVKDNSYLSLASFKSLKNTLFTDKLPLNIKSIVLPESGKVSQSLQVFDAQLRKATAVMIKLDPSELPTVTYNAENKPIYRYVRPNPISLMALEIRTKGLKSVLESDPMWELYFKDFMMNDPELKDLLNEVDSDKARKWEAYFRNFTNALYGGVQQFHVDKYVDGQNYQNIQPQTAYLLSYVAFAQRKNVVEEVNGEIVRFQTYLKQFVQQESTNTSYLIPAIHTSFTSVINGQAKLNTYKDAHTGKDLYIITKLFEQKVEQEFARAKQEWNTKDEAKERYLNYNIGLQHYLEDGRIKYKEVTNDPSLRAYKNMLFNDIFTTDTELKRIWDNVFNNDVNTYQDLSEDDKAIVREKLSEYAKNEANLEIKKLRQHKVITNDKGELDFSLLPQSVKAEGIDISISNLYGEKDAFQYFIYDKVFNDLYNAVSINEALLGDLALNIKDKIDFTKRNKSLSAAGFIFGNGFHKVAVLNTILEFIHDDYPQHGPYQSLQDIENDPSLDDKVRNILTEEFKNQLQGNRIGPMFQKTFDGQSFTLLMHGIDMLDQLGRLNDRAIDLLIQKHFRELSVEEIEYLEKGQVVLNPKKTVTASKFAYHKLSEVTIDRNEVSLLIDPLTNQYVTDSQRRLEIYTELHDLWRQVYGNRKLSNKYQAETNEIENLYQSTQQIIDKIHEYYIPIPGREQLHSILNSMEYHQVDQLIDTEASKIATILPLDFTNTQKDNLGRVNLSTASRLIDNSTKYLQVETSGIHDDVAYSVQRKLLVPADLYDIETIIAKEEDKSGIPLTTEEKQALTVINSTLQKYQTSLKDSAEARYEFFQTMIKKDGKLDIGNLYKMIRENLTLQNSPESMVKMFATDEQNNPVINPNFPVIRQSLIYYLFSLYSKNINDEKTFGMKYIHESPFGKNVVVDSNDKVIRTDEIKDNPSLYLNEDGTLKAGYRNRPLQIVKEVKDGVTHYVIEVMTAKPLIEDKREFEFYINNLMRGFGVRIPTEDKRSMISFKVVDFVDSSKRNSFVMPYIAHMLAGSDFDVDALYGQLSAYYKDKSNKFHKYGDYSNFKNEKHGKYIEYLSYMTSLKEFKNVIQKATMDKKNDVFDFDKLSENTDLMFYIEALQREDDFFELSDPRSLKEVQDVKKPLLELRSDLRKGIKDLMIQKKDIQNSIDIETNNVTREALILSKQAINAKLTALIDNQNELKFSLNALDKEIKIKTKIANFIATQEVLDSYSIPNSPNDALYGIVSYKYQNDNLNATMDLVSNAAVFNRLYINQRSSVDAFEKATKEGFGVTLEKLKPVGNIFSTAYQIEAKTANSGFKDGISKSASSNKFFALAGQYGLTLNTDQVIWNFTRTANNIKEKAYYDKYGHLVDTYNYINNEDGSTTLVLNYKNGRTVEIAGNIIGMFADGAKKPLPIAMGFNDINTSISLSMIGIGLPLEFAIGFNYLGVIKKAVEEVKLQENAVFLEFKQGKKNFISLLEKSLETEFSSEVLEELIQAGLINSYADLTVNNDNLIIDWNPVELDINKLEANTINSVDAGYTVASALKDNQTLTPKAQEYMLLKMYIAQAKQSVELITINYLSGLFKAYNPDLKAFDRIVDALSTIKREMDSENGPTLFTKDSMQRMLDDSQIFSTLIKTTGDLNSQLNAILLEKQPLFRDIVNIFSGYYDHSQEISQKIIGYIAINSFMNTYKRNIPNSTDEKIRRYDEQDRINLLKAFDHRTIYFDDIEEELKEMKNRFPDNSFLQVIQIDNRYDKKIKQKENNKVTSQHAKLTRVISLHKLKDNNTNGKIVNDLQLLLLNSDPNVRLFANKLFYRELARTGLQSRVQGNYTALYSDMFIKLSKPLNEFFEQLSNPLNDPASIITSFKNMMNIESEKELEAIFNGLAVQLISGMNSESKSASSLDRLQIDDSVWGLGNSLNELETMEDLQNAVTYLFNNAFTMTIKDKDKGHGVFNFKSDTMPDTLTINAELRQEGLLSENSRTADRILSKLGIEGMQEDKKTIYSFPPVLHIGETKYMITGVNGNTTSTLGSSLIGSLKNNEDFKLVGWSASYIKINTADNSTVLKPVHYTSKQLDILNKYKTATVLKDAWVDTYSTLEKAENNFNERSAMTSVKVIEPIQQVTTEVPTVQDIVKLAKQLNKPFSDKDIEDFNNLNDSEKIKVLENLKNCL
ncbi:MAG: hypothetical protein EOL97_04640 [Spirochaetia bacterium]|nr:hypothetical protein [Spirochaetia bacterium]